MSLTDADVAIAAARAGADVVSRDFGCAPTRFAKSPTDFATQTDIDAEKAIVDVLMTHRPGDGRTGEELGDTGPAERRWFIDPLCGTLNFAAGTPLAAVNVALMSGTVPLAAAVADPISDELFWTDGISAYIRRSQSEEPLKPTSSSGLVDINCDGPLDRPFVGGQLVADARLRQAYGPRVISSTLGVAWAAAGRRAAYISDGDLRDSVHFAAGIAVCAAAGCVVSDLAGDGFHTGRGLIVAADSETHQAMVELVEPHLAAVR